jgi:hypothetical protein
MRARFEVRSIKSQWKPPFKKDITDEVFDVGEGESFDRIVGNGNDEHVFKLINVGNGTATVEYSKLFTQKTHNPGNYQLSLVKDAPAEMTYLWGEDGVTKKIIFKGVSGAGAVQASEPTEETNSE